MSSCLSSRQSDAIFDFIATASSTFSAFLVTLLMASYVNVAVLLRQEPRITSIQVNARARLYLSRSRMHVPVGLSRSLPPPRAFLGTRSRVLTAAGAGGTCALIPAPVRDSGAPQVLSERRGTGAFAVTSR